MKHKIYFGTCGLSLAGFTGSIFLVAVLGFFFFGRPQPSEANQSLFRGINYIRDVRSSPRPMVVHFIKINLREEGISFFVTPGNPEAGLPVASRKTSQFLEEFGLQLAINGDGVTPWRSNNLLDYYPHVGDPVDPIGLAASQGIVYSPATDAEPTMYINRNNRARINSPIGGVYNAISGNALLVKDGKIVDGLEDIPQPRTALALDQRRREMIIVIVDGRQPNYSEGATLNELAEILIEHGGYTAINLDGGGSSTLVAAGKNGNARILNSPIDQHIPGRERPVGNHLGIYALPLD